jgi:Protein of unknown function (DUF2799)
MSKLAWTLPVVFLSGCAAFSEPDSSNLSTYCTAETGYRVGYLSKAYYGVCPKQTENAFLTGLQRGRGYRQNPPQALPYYQRMEGTEKQLLASASDAERERLRGQLREIEWWTIHIVFSPGSYAGDGGGRN